MRPSVKIPPLALAVLCVIATQTDAHAQAAASGATRPYRALFGGSTADPSVHHSLDVTASAIQGYDDNIATGLSSLTQSSSALLSGGAFAGYSAALGYAWQGRRMQIGANLGSDGRYFYDASDFVGVSHYGGLGLGAEIGRRGRLFVNQSVTRAPSYLYSLTPAHGPLAPGAVVGGGAYPLGQQPVTVFDTTASTRYNLSRRGSLEGEVTHRYSNLATSTTGGVRNLRAFSVGGRYRHGLSRDGSLRIGYFYREGRYAASSSGRTTPIHDIDVGVDYGRALSLTRRTTVDFSSGSSIVTLPQSATGDAANQLTYRLTLDAGLTHEMGRTWRARVAYSRGFGFAEAFSEPAFSDSVSGSVTGFLARRVDFSASGRVANGEVGLGASQSPFVMWNVSTRARYALSPMWAVYGEASYYSQDLGEAPLVSAAFPPVLDRKSVQVGLTVWVPLVKR